LAHVDSRPAPLGDGGRVSAAEGWSMFALAALLTAAVGMAAASATAVNWRALAALAHAQDVLRQEPEVNLALIGFVEPPLTSLLYIPIAWLAPKLVTSGDAVWILGAVVAGLTIRLLSALCADVGVGPVGRWALCAVALANPVYLGLVATGSPGALYVLLLLGAGWALLRWQRAEALRDLIGCSIFLSFACLTRYDALVPILAATLVVGWHTVRGGGGWSKLEGTLITFLLPIVYVAGLWVLANWLIIGDPWHFWRLHWQTETPAAASALPAWQGVLGATTVFAPLLAVAWWAGWGGASGRTRLALGAALLLLCTPIAVLLLPGLFAAWANRVSEADLPLMPIAELFAPMLAAGWFLAACAIGDVRALFERKSITKEICLAGSGALLAFGCLSVLVDDGRAYVDPRPALVGRPFGAAEATSTREVAAKLNGSLASQTGGPVVVAGWPGYAVTLYAERVRDKVLLVSTDPPAEPIKGPPAVGLLVRNGHSLEEDGALREAWVGALGTQLAAKPAWILDGWAFYPRQASRTARAQDG